ncbi:UDP-N-acetylmuramoyl-tripeptide--D-alanyl-D-alanine ligase [Arenimonas sp. GDDSR-1]|uniref:UDP-N-acetylmuramoyl-tripeptide--D-alanyl-D- alanine ligase n=1 Tax=Arenimonas sp. GDDSR-1 TaxID=2950125 RepID=UPI00260D6AF5|nr:UDP-N-acetylmuramoyl-tripeptide--D-alanyl-D-alanine ligase [Arenimonas sp. GDDSR-1]
MRTVMLSQLALWCEGRLLGDDVSISRISTDSRDDLRGALFVALKGERFDAHEFVNQAKANGAAALLTHRPVDSDLPTVLCADTEEALGEMAGGFATSRPAVVLALTGSNGKTSVKTLLHAILQEAGKAYVNPGNRNNEIGLPLAVIDAPEDAQFAIYEMGAGKPGDIAYLTSIVTPNIALVNNIAPAHIERMGSLLGIAETKGAIYEALPDDGLAVVNVDDAFCPYFLERIAGRGVLRFGLENNADVTASGIALTAEGSRFELITPAGRAGIDLQMPGRHNILNALAATAMALAAGAPLEAIAAGLQSARPVAGRQDGKLLGNGAVLIDDSYNANPGSVLAGIASLAAACALDGKQSVLVLGDMAELGGTAADLHAQIGAAAKSQNITRLMTCGVLSAAASDAFGSGARHFADRPALIAALNDSLQGNQRLLVKGSRSSRMDEVVSALLHTHGTQEKPDAA